MAALGIWDHDVGNIEALTVESPPTPDQPNKNSQPPLPETQTYFLGSWNQDLDMGS